MGKGHEKRRYLRTAFRGRVYLKLPGKGAKPCPAEVKDLSLRGAYIFLDYKYPPGTRCELDICLGGDENSFCIHVNGKVVWNDERGAGIEFEEMDIESLRWLKQVLYYNTGMPEEIDRELTGKKDL